MDKIKQLLIDGIRKLASAWNWYGGIAISYGIAWILNFSKEKMDSAGSFVVLSLSFVAVFTFLKKQVSNYKKDINSNIINNNTNNSNVNGKKGKKSNGSNLGDTVIMQQSSVKAMNVASDPDKTGEELGMIIIKTSNLVERTGTKLMKVLKKLGLFIKTYKGALTAFLMFAVTLAIEFVEQFQGCFTEIVGVEWFRVIQAVCYGLEVLIAVFSYGLGSPELKEKIAILKDTMDGDSVEQVQYINDRKFLRKQIKNYDEQVNDVEKEIATLEASYREIIDEIASCNRLGLTADNETVTKHNEYGEKKKALTQKLENKQFALLTYKEKLEQLEEAHNPSDKESK